MRENGDRGSIAHFSVSSVSSGPLKIDTIRKSGSKDPPPKTPRSPKPLQNIVNPIWNNRELLFLFLVKTPDTDNNWNFQQMENLKIKNQICRTFVDIF